MEFLFVLQGTSFPADRQINSLRSPRTPSSPADLQYAAAFNNFRDDLKWLASQNNDVKLESVYNPTYYSDMTWEEFQSSVLMDPAAISSTSASSASECLPPVTPDATSSLPSSIDWREKQAVTKVQQQGVVRNPAILSWYDFRRATLLTNVVLHLTAVRQLLVRRRS